MLFDEPECDICKKEIDHNDVFEGRPMCDRCAESLEEKRERLLDLLNRHK